MKLKVVLFSVFFLFFIIPSISFAETEVSGIISEDTIWDKTGSPYIVKGNVLVDEGGTLTIKEGVEVKFQGYYYLQVKGKLNAIGTKEEKIQFKQGSALELKSDNNLIENAVFSSFTWSGVDIDEGNNNVIRNCTFENNSPFGIFIRSSNNNRIEGSDFSNSRIRLHISDNNVITKNNIYQSNDSYGSIEISASEFNEFTNNTIFNNKIGIEIGWEGNNNIITNNNIYNNLDYNIKVSKKEPNETIDLSNNYWGIIDRGEISNKIYDYYDDFNYAKINFEPFLQIPYGSNLVNSNYQTGSYNSPIEVELSVTGEGYEIYYTLDGSDPKTNGIKYTQPILVNKSTTLKVVTFKDGTYGEVTTVSYDINLFSSIQGNVKFDDESNHSGVRIFLYSGSNLIKTTSTDAQGKYVFSNIDSGVYSVKSEKIPQYLTDQIININVVGGEDNILPNLNLISGDLNNDNKIDLYDLNILSKKYGNIGE